MIINRVIENGFFYKKQDVKYALKDSSLFTLLSRKFYNQFINLYYRHGFCSRLDIFSQNQELADSCAPLAREFGVVHK